MSARFAAIVVIAALALGLAPLITRAQRVPAGVPPPEAIFVAGTPTIIVPAEAGKVWWSPTGRYALAVLSDAQDDHPARLVSISSASGKASEIWRSPSNATEVSLAGWFAASNVAMIQIVSAPDSGAGQAVTPVVALLRVDARGGKVKPVPGISTPASYDASPTHPIMIAERPSDNGSKDISAFRPDGTILRAVHVSPERTLGGSTVYLVLDGWCPDGVTARISQLELAQHTDPVTGRIQAARTYITWNTSTGQVQSGPTAPLSLPRLATQPGIVLTRDPVIVTNGAAKATLRPVWLNQGSGRTPRRLLISPDSDWAEVAPTNTGVLVLSRGSVSLTPLRRVSGDALAALREQERAEAFDRAKSVGLALRMYADDYSGSYPPTGDSFASALDPLLKSEDLLKSPGTGIDFIYLGGNTTSDPASHAIGYLTTDAGRAVVYADGHVAWTPG